MEGSSKAWIANYGSTNSKKKKGYSIGTECDKISPFAKIKKGACETSLLN